MKTNTTIYNHYAGGIDEYNSYPTTISCEITMSQEEIIDELGDDVARKLGINVEKYINNDLDFDEEDYQDKTICTIEIAMYPNAEEADLHSDEGTNLYECAMKFFGEEDSESVIVNLAMENINETMYTPGILLNVIPHENLDHEDLDWLYPEITEQISTNLRLTRLLMNYCFRYVGDTFVGIPCTSKMNLKMAEMMFAEDAFLIDSIQDWVLNIARLEDIC